MNKNQFILLVVVAVVIGGIGYSLRSKQQASWTQSAAKMGDKVIENLDVNKVEAMTIKSPSGSISLAKKGDIWTVQERSDYPANFGSIHDFLIKAMELKVGQPVKASAGQLGRLELSAPDKGTNGGTLVELKDSSGKSLHTIVLGKKVMREGGASASPFGGGGGGFPVGRYIMVGNDPKNVSIVSEAFASIEPKAGDWLDKDFLKVEKLKTISVSAEEATNSWKAVRETENAEWALADAKGEEKFDTSKVSGFNYLLNSPSFADVVASDKKAEDTGLDKPSTAVLTTFDGFTYTVKLGKTDAEGRQYAQFAVAAEIPKERAAGPDEKPEDKEKLDKEFKEKTGKLQEKLKKEQFHDKWVYLFDKWSVDNLLKKRHELLAEKKAEEPKKEGESSEASPLPKLD
ncbi:MAG: DUF4340 domain-containing protein [Verrucomicrobia bacterium]|nr:DUF4340 domain-containing protein [Verrucomicrobiota bacterium]